MTRKSPTSQNRHSDIHSYRHSNKSNNLAPAGEFPLSTGTAPAGTQDIPGMGIKSVPPQPGLSQTASYATGQLSQDTPATGQTQLKTQPSTSFGSSADGPTSQEVYPLASAFVDLPDDPDDSEQYSYSEPDEGMTNMRLQRT